MDKTSSIESSLVLQYEDKSNPKGWTDNIFMGQCEFELTQVDLAEWWLRYARRVANKNKHRLIARKIETITTESIIP